MNYFVIKEQQSKELMKLGVYNFLSRHDSVIYVGSYENAKKYYDRIQPHENEYWITTRKFLVEAGGKIREGLTNEKIFEMETFTPIQ